MATAIPTQQQVQVAAEAAAAGGGGFANASLYVGDLDPTVNEGQLYDLFSQVAQVVSVRVCRDQARRTSLGYAYVNFGSAQDAANALELLNFSLVNGRPIRIMFSHRDPSIRKSGYANVFIKNLDTSIDNKALNDTFAAFGTVISCKVAIDANGQSKGYGFVQFEQEEAAQNAIKRLNGMLINDKQVYVGLFVRRQERSRGNGSPKFTNIYVKNFSENTTDEELKKFFGSYGPITSAVVMRDGNGKSRCFGFVNFQNPDDAAAAVENLNGTSLNNDDKVLYVGKAQRKSEREAELRAKFEQERNSRFEKLQGANLYLKNLDDTINDVKLKELFSEFGTITSCKVMIDSQGVSKGSGFVAFTTPEEATKALNEMNGKMIGRKPLYVAVAQRKEERRVQLQAHFSHVQAPGGMAPLPTGMPGFHPGLPRLAPPQQLYFGQGAPGLLPPQPAGYGFQQQLLPEKDIFIDLVDLPGSEAKDMASESLSLAQLAKKRNAEHLAAMKKVAVVESSQEIPPLVPKIKGALVPTGASAVKELDIALSVATAITLLLDKAAFRVEPDVVSIIMVAQNAIVLAEAESNRANEEHAKTIVEEEKTKQVDLLCRAGEERANFANAALKTAHEELKKLKVELVEAKKGYVLPFKAYDAKKSDDEALNSKE
ncbi:hypothetical protein TEA_006224 [Camellia sinensis var. sinensis]|uniref:RRM domain-containing protein n=1 Tax=Camellia sinensis var. sinensis TaxID=542762 RepID=A0A4S4D0M1_CAMSN|nr:hypothetical protein TEA_006224 [Camellia sinensis var. sinensis]